MNYKQVIAIRSSKEKIIKQLIPSIQNRSGIYMFTRIDENKIKFAYIGQAKKLIQRLVDHLLGYEHIDLSIRKRKFYTEENKEGWNLAVMYCEENQLDYFEQKLIKQYADAGYQLYNKTAGGQQSKNGFDSVSKPTKNYHDGLKQGYSNCKKEVAEYFEKYLTVAPIDDRKKNGEIKEIYLRKHNEFLEWLKNG